MIAAPWDASLTWFNLEFSGQYDLLPGAVVTVTDGTTIKTHTITSVQVLRADAATDVVSGTAEPDSYVDLQICFPGGCAYRTELADSNGNWSTDFGTIGDQAWELIVFNILPGTGLDSPQWEGDIDSTMVRSSAKSYVFLPLTVRP